MALAFPATNIRRAKRSSRLSTTTASCWRLFLSHQPMKQIPCADLKIGGSYLNLDGGFDSRYNRKAIFNAWLIPNIKENPRNREIPKRGRKRLFNAAIHASLPSPV